MIETATTSPVARPTHDELVREYYATIPTLHVNFESAWRWATSTGQPVVTAWAWMSDGQLHKIRFDNTNRDWWTSLGSLKF